MNRFEFTLNYGSDLFNEKIIESHKNSKMLDNDFVERDMNDFEKDDEKHFVREVNHE